MHQNYLEDKVTDYVFKIVHLVDLLIKTITYVISIVKMDILLINQHGNVLKNALKINLVIIQQIIVKIFVHNLNFILVILILKLDYVY